jgi:hypothetical protein
LFLRSDDATTRNWQRVHRSPPGVVVVKPAEDSSVINQSLRCPSCGQFGFIVETDAADLEEFVATICHYCGHVLDRDGLAECLARGEAERTAPSANRGWRAPRRPTGRG